MDTRCRIEMFGALRVKRGSQCISHFPTYKTGALLTYLVYYMQRPHPRDVLVELLWPESALEAGRQSLSRALSSLRHQLEPPGVRMGEVILADRLTVQINPSAVVSDVFEFCAALADARTNFSLSLLVDALQFYAGPLLPAHYEDWVLQERDHLQQAYLSTLNRLVVGLERAGDLRQALEYARQAVLADPLDEPANAALVRLHLALGEPAAALRHFRKQERIVETTLGVPPDPAERARLQQQVLAVPRHTGASSIESALHNSAPGALEAPRARPAHEASLPVALTRFHGRELEIEQALRVLGIEPLQAPSALLSNRGARLLTLTGPGGMGKTRLAIEIARQATEALQGAVWFVPLAAVSEAQALADAIADVIKAPRLPGGALESVMEALSGQPALLILDNFEQLLADPFEAETALRTDVSIKKVEESAGLVRSLLEHLPDLRCLVTSRQSLGIEGEQEAPVDSLQTPLLPETPEQMARYASVALFVDRAQAVRPEFQITRGNAVAIAGLCERLEGIPLALELAAARAQVFSPAQMLRQIERRFDFLVSRKRLATDRHRTLRAALDWSYRLLSPQLQMFFGKLSVFQGGCTHEAAEAVCSEPLALDYLSQLRECSLTRAEEDSAGDMRFQSLESIREYGESTLTPDAQRDLRRAHALYFVEFAETANVHAGQPDQITWLARLEREQENLQAAIAWSIQAGAVEIGLRLINALVQFGEIHGPIDELERQIAQLLSAAEAEEITPSVYAASLVTSGMFAYFRDELAEGLALLQKGLDLYRDIGDQQHIGATLNAMGILASQSGDGISARRYHEEGLAIWQALGYWLGVGQTLNNLGKLAEEQGDIETASRLLEECLDLSVKMGEERSMGYALHNLGEIAFKAEDFEKARSCYCKALQIRFKLGDKIRIIGLLQCLAHDAEYRKDYGRGATLLGAAAGVCRAIHLRLPASNLEDIAPLLRNQRAELGDSAFEAAWTVGMAMTLEQAVAFALEETPD